MVSRVCNDDSIMKCPTHEKGDDMIITIINGYQIARGTNNTLMIYYMVTRTPENTV